MTNFARSASSSNVTDIREWQIGSSSVTDWKYRALLKLQTTIADENPPDEYTFLTACNFFDCLPSNISEPEIDVDANGCIVFEWYKKETDKAPSIFTVLIRSRSLIVSNHIEGIPRMAAAFETSAEVTEIIVDKLVLYFGVKPYGRRTTAQ